MLAHQDALLDLGLLDVALLAHRINAVTVLRRDHLVILHLLHLLLHLVIVALLEFHDLTSTLACFLNLLSSLQFFLFEQRDSIC